MSLVEVKKQFITSLEMEKHMKSVYYQCLGAKMMAYVNSNNFTEYELGKVFEQIYLTLLQEEERDLRDEANGKGD